MNPHSDSGDWVYHYHRARAQQARAVGLAMRRALRWLRRCVRDVLLALNGYPGAPVFPAGAVQEGQMFLSAGRFGLCELERRTVAETVAAPGAIARPSQATRRRSAHRFAPAALAGPEVHAQASNND